MRGGFRGRRGFFRGKPGIPPQVGPRPPTTVPPGRLGVFDFSLVRDSFNGTKNTTDAVFEKEILDRADALTPSHELKNKIIECTDNVIKALEMEKIEKSVADVIIEQVAKVGSFTTDTALNINKQSEVVVQLSTLPSFETMTGLGGKVVENLKKLDPKDNSINTVHDYGCCIMIKNINVRILVTIIPEESQKLEPGLHLSEKQMMINFFAIRHVKWFQMLIETSEAEFIQEFRALIRVLKDVKLRYEDFKPLSSWVIQYLSYYCLTNGPNRQKVNLGTAFRRFFEVLASGILLPKATVLIDPTSMSHRIGFDLDYHQMDMICMAAQTSVRIFASGNDGYRAILGTHISSKGVDLPKTPANWNGINITPALEAYKEGCMEPYLKEEVTA